MAEEKILINHTILEFQRTVELDDNLTWKKCAEKQERFVRDEIGRHLLKVPIFVISTHTSKSCLLPVYGFIMRNGICIRMRENFYGWVMSIVSPKFTFDLPEDLVHGDSNEDEDGNPTDCKDIHHCYCEGFKEGWVYPYKTKETNETTVRVSNDYDLYTLLYHLNQLGDHELFSSVNLAKDEDTVLQHMIVVARNHPAASDIFELFPRTFHKADNYKFVQENQLDSYMPNSITGAKEFAHRIVSYPEINKLFNEELTLLLLGEILDNNPERLNWINDIAPDEKSWLSEE